MGAYNQVTSVSQPSLDMHPAAYNQVQGRRLLLNSGGDRGENIYIYIYIPLFCRGRVLMVDIFIIFRVHHYFRVQILAFLGQ